MGEFTGDATPDVLLVNDQTGGITLWEMIGGATPRVARASSLVGLRRPPARPSPPWPTSTGNGTPDLFFQDRATGRVTVRLMNRKAAIGVRDLPIEYARGRWWTWPTSTGTSNLDLLWKTTEGTLVATLLDSAGMRRAETIVGRLTAGWELAEAMDIDGGAADDLIIEDIATGSAAALEARRPGPQGHATASRHRTGRVPADCPGGRAVSVPDVYATRPLVVVVGAAVVATAGTPVTAVVATFTDADPTAAVGRYAATVDWGDGTAPTGPDGPVRGRRRIRGGRHAHLRGGRSVLVVVSVVDTTRGPEGRRGTAIGSASIAAVPPVTPPYAPVTPPVTPRSRLRSRPRSRPGHGHRPEDPGRDGRRTRRLRGPRGS